MSRHSQPWLEVGVALMLMLSAAQVWAAARATVQPERITLGNTATLTIETDEANVTPDFSALEQSFTLRGQSSSMQTMINNGQATARTTFSVELEPREAGVITVPPIQVGNSSTESVSLTVLPPAQGSAASGDPIYIESELGTTTPYVQQAVPYTVRLYYAVPLVGGDVTAPPPEHASLQQLGEDRQSQVEVNGRRYGVFERRYLLIPEQSGALQLPAAKFRGSAQVGGGNGFFSRTQNVSAVGQVFNLDVRAQPANAPKPWLAARTLALARADLPPSARAGEPLLLELTLTADGATSAQLPDLELPPIAGAQVFPEPAQRSDSLVNGQPVAALKRRFAIVPAHAGPLQLPALKLPYWNTASDRVDAAQLAAITLDVAAAANVPMPAAPAAPVANQAAATSPAAPLATDAQLASALQRWQWTSALLSLGLLAALIWGWQRGRGLPRAVSPDPLPSEPVAANPAELQRALAHGDLAEIAQALRCSTTPRGLNLGATLALLADSEQRAAVQALERLLWAGNHADGEHAAVRTRLRAAFKTGVRLASNVRKPSMSPLAPLYPLR